MPPLGCASISPSHGLMWALQVQFLAVNHQIAMVQRIPMERVFKGHCFDSVIGLHFNTTELRFSTTPSSTTCTHLKPLSYRYNQIHATVARTGSGLLLAWSMQPWDSRCFSFMYLINAVLKCPTVSGGVAMPAGFAAGVGEIPRSHCRLPEAQPVRHGAASGPVPHGGGTQAASAQGLRRHPATLHRQVGRLHLSARSASHHLKRI